MNNINAGISRMIFHVKNKKQNKNLTSYLPLKNINNNIKFSGQLDVISSEEILRRKLNFEEYY